MSSLAERLLLLVWEGSIIREVGVHNSLHTVWTWKSPINFKKSLLAYVCVHSICSKPCTITPFVSYDRYDHLKALIYSYNVIWRRRKFPESYWNRDVYLVKSYLFEVCPLRTLSRSISFFKNHHELTFATIEFFLSLIRSSRLFLQAGMIICKPPSTHIMSWRHVENFLQATEVTVSTW